MIQPEFNKIIEYVNDDGQINGFVANPGYMLHNQANQLENGQELY